MKKLNEELIHKNMSKLKKKKNKKFWRNKKELKNKKNYQVKKVKVKVMIIYTIVKDVVLNMKLN